MPLDSDATTSRAILNDIFAQLAGILASAPGPKDDASRPVNLLEKVPAAAKSLLLTLHVLYPNELLPALDLLDRHLLTKFVLHEQSNINVPFNDPQTTTRNDGASIDQGAADAEMSSTEQQDEDSKSNANTEAIEKKSPSSHPSLYFVRSAQQPTRFNSHGGRFHDPLALTTHYEVRTQAWNCSCPAFVFAAFPPPDLDVATTTQRVRSVANEFGGLAVVPEGLSLPPVCKHLLACAFVEICGDVFVESIETKVVSVEEMAGWCAGWGD